MQDSLVSAWGGAALLLIAIVFSFVFPSPYALGIGITAATFAVLATSLNLVFGYGGLLSFAQVGFFGLGAYTAAILVVDTGWSFWPAALAGGVLAALLGVFIGFASLRLSRIAFVIVSLAMTLILHLLAKDLAFLTRGPAGLPGLPAPTVSIPGLSPVEFDTPRTYYWLSLTVSVALLLLVRWVIGSGAGRMMMAIRLDEPLAKAQGIDPLPYRLLAIGLSAFIAGVIGAVHVFNLTIVDPSIFDMYYTEAILIMVLLGGPGSFVGVLAAALIFTVLPELLRISVDARSLIYGLLLIALALFLPNGIAELPRRIARRARVSSDGDRREADG
ncbi:MAG: branched-chain amino acid ABC transporter permease [Gammaproteobacteria bacterium]|nr:branched-chain amino acid ABC transporter permease [Gammaproteobacteria bacterium]